MSQAQHTSSWRDPWPGEAGGVDIPTPDANDPVTPGDNSTAVRNVDILTTLSDDGLPIQSDGVPAIPGANSPIIPNDGDPNTSNYAAPGSGCHPCTLMGILIFHSSSDFRVSSGVGIDVCTSPIQHRFVSIIVGEIHKLGREGCPH